MEHSIQEDDSPKSTPSEITMKDAFNGLSEKEQNDIIYGTITAVGLNMMNWQAKLGIKDCTGTTCLCMMQLLSEFGIKMNVVIGVCLCYKDTEIIGVFPHCWCETSEYIIDPSMDIRRADIEQGVTMRQYYGTLDSLFKRVAPPETMRRDLITAVLRIEKNMHTLYDLGPESEHMRSVLNIYQMDSFTDKEQVQSFNSTMRAAIMSIRGTDVYTGIGEQKDWFVGTDEDVQSVPVMQKEHPHIHYPM